MSFSNAKLLKQQTQHRRNMKNMATQKVDIIETPMTAQQLAGHLEGLVIRVKNGSFGQKHFEALAEGRDPFAPMKCAEVDINDRVEWWAAHYRGFYKINPDFSNLYIPTRVVGFDRLVIIPKSLTHQKWVQTAQTIHEVYLYKDDLDGFVNINDRTPKDRSYGIWIRDRQEADQELESKSANTLAEEKVKGITLLERLVAGEGYLFDKMCHMDQNNVTLCSGSRVSDGNVPGVGWGSDGRRVFVRWSFPSNADPGLRARAVVS